MSKALPVMSLGFFSNSLIYANMPFKLNFTYCAKYTENISLY